MEVLFKPSFVRDFKKLPREAKEEVRRICLVVFPSLDNLKQFSEYDLKTLKGFHGYYRVRVGEYRIGLKEKNGGVTFMRVKHRKDIYQVFP